MEGWTEMLHGYSQAHGTISLWTCEIETNIKLVKKLVKFQILCGEQVTIPKWGELPPGAGELEGL